MQNNFLTRGQLSIAVIYYSFLDSIQRNTAEVYCQQLDGMHGQLNEMRSALATRRNTILLHENTRTNFQGCKNVHLPIKIWKHESMMCVSISTKREYLKKFVNVNKA